MHDFCSMGFDSISINSSGLVLPCLCDAWHTKEIVGDLKKNSLIEIVDNNNYLDFKESIIDQSFKYCHTNCPYKWNLEKVDQIPDFAFQKQRLPTWILLKIDKNCNLRCPSCRTTNIFSPEINPRAQSILTRLNTEYKNFKDPVLLQIDGLGDIFSSAAYLEFLNNPDLADCFRFFIITNGNLVTKNLDLIKKIQTKIQSVEISFDAATADTYKQVRGGKFKTVTDGVSALLDLGIHVQTQYVVQQKNYHEILDYITLSKSLGVREEDICLKGITKWNHMDLNWWLDNRLEQNPSVNYDLLIRQLETIEHDTKCNIDGVLSNLLYQHRNKLT